MNKVFLVGTFTRDPEVKNSQQNNMVAKWTLAIDRKFKDVNGEYGTDFINCVAFGKTAQFVEKYFTKGMRIGLDGRIQTGSYNDKDGRKVYTTDIVAENVEFVERKSATPTEGKSEMTEQEKDQFIAVVDNELPF